MDEDLKLRPEWEPYTPVFEGLFSLEEESAKPGCPFADIANYLQ